MKILIQGDLFMRSDILEDCLEKALTGTVERLEFDTINLDTPAGTIPLPKPEDTDSRNTWNLPSDDPNSVYEFNGAIDLLEEPIQDADFLVLHTAAVTRKVLESAAQLKAVACGRGGPVNIDVAAATELGIPVLATPGRNAKAVAEFIIGMILAQARNIVVGHEGLKQGQWIKGLYHYDVASPGLDGARLGMVGFGGVGRILAPLAHAFNMKMTAYDPYMDADAMAQYNVEKVPTLDKLIPSVDFLVVLARYTKETHHMIGAREFAMMKPTAYFLNPARGGLVDYDALYPVLREKRIKGASLDVYAMEPFPANSPLLTLDNVVLTPHIAGATQETVHIAGQMIAEDIRRIVQGEAPVNCINPEVIDKQ